MALAAISARTSSTSSDFEGEGGNAAGEVCCAWADGGADVAGAGKGETAGAAESAAPTNAARAEKAREASKGRQKGMRMGKDVSWDRRQAESFNRSSPDVSHSTLWPACRL